MSNTNNSGNNSINGNYTIPINTTSGGTVVTAPNYITWVPNQSFTITIGGSGGGGGGVTPAVSGDVGPETEKKKKDKGGCKCKKCKEFFDYAEPNQSDGTLICWSCRHGY